jgi:hypothetical protein
MAETTVLRELSKVSNRNTMSYWKTELGLTMAELYLIRCGTKSGEEKN